MSKDTGAYTAQAATFFSDNVDQFRLGAIGNAAFSETDPPSGSTANTLDQNSKFQEGNSGQYEWMYPPNVSGDTYSVLTEHFSNTMATLVSNLDTHLSVLNEGTSSNKLFFGNEPGHFTPFVYCYSNQANVYKTQRVVRRIQKDMYKNQVHRALAGNDDLSAMSSWYVWAAIGLYPSIPGLGHFDISSPLFDKFVIRLSDSHDLVIKTTGTEPSSEQQYIKTLKLNGTAYDKTYFNLEEVFGAGSSPVLEFELTNNSSEAKTDWGTLSPSFTSLDDLDGHL